MIPRRRRYLIDPLQVRLLLQQWIYIALFLLVYSVIVFGPMVMTLRGSDAFDAREVEVASRFLDLHETLWPALFVLFLLSGVHSVIVSHRIAGPLFRFRETMVALTSGDPVQPVKLRRGDYLRREAEALNRVVALVRTPSEVDLDIAAEEDADLIESYQK